MRSGVGGAHGDWGGRGGSVTAAQVNTGLWLADNVNTELWLVVATMTQSASPGYSDTEDRDELTNALRQESGNLKSDMSWTVSIVVKLEFSLQYMNPNSKYQIPCLTHFITCQRGHFWMKMCAHMVWELCESPYLMANSKIFQGTKCINHKNLNRKNLGHLTGPSSLDIS